jgi:hypothetical protein
MTEFWKKKSGQEIPRLRMNKARGAIAPRACSVALGVGVGA